MGTFGDMSCWSLQSHKAVNVGEGGMLVTDNEDFAAKAAIYAGSYERCYNKHFDLDPSICEKYTLDVPSYSMRMTEVSAAIGYDQLDRLEVVQKIQKANYYLVKESLEKENTID